MKVFNVVVKLVVALAAVAGAVYVAATYGDKIVAWCKKTLSCCKCCGGECCCDEADVADEACEEPVEEAVVEESPAEEAPAEDAAPVADEADFEG